MAQAHNRPSFNYIESFFEIEITPEDLKRIAGEIERMEQEFHTPGQVIRYKLSSNFALVHRPEKKRIPTARVENPKQSFVPAPPKALEGNT